MWKLITFVLYKKMQISLEKPLKMENERIFQVKCAAHVLLSSVHIFRRLTFIEERNYAWRYFSRKPADVLAVQAREPGPSL